MDKRGYSVVLVSENVNWTQFKTGQLDLDRTLNLIVKVEYLDDRVYRIMQYQPRKNVLVEYIVSDVSDTVLVKWLSKNGLSPYFA